MNTRITGILLMLVLASACGNDGAPAGTATASTEVAVTETEPTGNKHWVDSTTVNAIPAEARGKVLGTSDAVPTDGESFVALASKLGSSNATERQASARAVSLTMSGAKGEYLRALEMQVPRYLSTHTKEFLDLFNGRQNMGKAELAAWASMLRGRANEVSPSAVQVLSDMKRNCGDCDGGQAEVFDYFMGMVTGDGGKKGGLK